MTSIGVRVALAAALTGTASCAAYGAPDRGGYDFGRDQGGAAGASGSGGAVQTIPARSVSAPIPPRPTPTPGESTGARVQAVRRFIFDSDKLAFAHAYAIDGLAFSDPEDPLHCKLQPEGKKADVVLDGPNGEDNSFGRNILPIFFGLNPDFQASNDAAISSGDRTLLIRVEGLGPGHGYDPLVADILPARGRRDEKGAPVVPSAWSTYQWEPWSEYLAPQTGAGDALQAKARLTDSYVVGDTWVSGAPRSLPLELMIYDAPLKLMLRHAVVTHVYSPDRTSTLTGTVSGVIDPEELVDNIRSAAGKISASLCSGATIDNVLSQIRAASDMMLDGTQGPSVCNGISLGIGYVSEESDVGAASASDLSKGCGP